MNYVYGGVNVTAFCMEISSLIILLSLYQCGRVEAVTMTENSRRITLGSKPILGPHGVFLRSRASNEYLLLRYNTFPNVSNSNNSQCKSLHWIKTFGFWFVRFIGILMTSLMNLRVPLICLQNVVLSFSTTLIVYCRFFFVHKNTPRFNPTSHAPCPYQEGVGWRTHVPSNCIPICFAPRDDCAHCAFDNR